MNILIKFLLLNLLLITSSFSQDQNYDEELNCDQFTELSFEVDQDQAPLTFYAYAPGIDNPIAMVRDHNGNGRFEDNEVFYFTKDHLGSIRELTDKDGNVVQRYRYSAYGETTIEKANPQTQHKILENRYAFTGREIELEFGCLYDFRNRTLNVCSKQFIEPDPIGFEAGDESFVRYVKNSPLNFNDPFGLAGGINYMTNQIVEGGGAPPVIIPVSVILGTCIFAKGGKQNIGETGKTSADIKQELDQAKASNDKKKINELKQKLRKQEKFEQVSGKQKRKSRGY